MTRLQDALSRHRWDAAVLTTAFLLFGTTMWARGALSELYTQDIFFTFDSMWRSALGQVPHRDFHSPIGQAFYWPFMLLAQFEPVTTKTMLHANVLVAAVALALGAFALRPRFAGPLYWLALFAIVTTILSPRDIGRNVDVFSHIAFYNRWGWSFLVLAALVCVVPPAREGAVGRGGRGWDLIAGAAAGVAAAVVLFLKATYFAGALGLLSFALLFRLADLRLAAGFAAGLLLIVLLAALAFGNLAGYIADIRMAVDANVAVDPLRLGKFKRHLLEGVVYGLIIGAVLWLRAPTFNPIAYMQTWWRELAVGAVLVIGGVGLATQNHPSSECPLFIAAVIATAELARRKKIPVGPRAASVASFVLAAAAAAFIPLLDATSVIAHAAATHGRGACRLAALEGTPGEALAFPPRAFSSEARAAGEAVGCDAEAHVATADPWENRVMTADVARVSGAMRLLEEKAPADAVILTLDFGNPYAMLRRAPSPEGALIWWDPARNYSTQVYPEIERLIGSTDVVLVPAPEVPATYYGEPLWGIYGEAIERDFNLAEDGRGWRIWVRSTLSAGRLDGPEGSTP